MENPGKELPVESSEEYTQSAIRLLRRLRYEDSEEFPEEIVHFGDYKCRGAWFVGITSTWENMITEILPVDFPDDDPRLVVINTNIEYFLGPVFQSKLAGRTDMTDIERGNQTIDLLLSIFEPLSTIS